MGEAYFTDVTDATRMTLGVGNLTFTVPHKVRRHPHGWAFSPKSLDGRAVVAREFRASRMPWRRREREREQKITLSGGLVSFLTPFQKPHNKWGAHAAERLDTPLKPCRRRSERERAFVRGEDLEKGWKEGLIAIVREEAIPRSTWDTVKAEGSFLHLVRNCCYGIARCRDFDELFCFVRPEP